MSFEAFVSSVEGPYHRKNSIPNQDVAYWDETSDYFIAAVADGAGSLKHSDEGAFIAGKAAVNAIVEKLKTKAFDFDELASLGIEAGRNAQRAKENFKAYGSTLVVAVLSRSGRWIAGAVGDSFVVVHTKAGAHELVTGASIHEYANVTELLTSDSITPVYQTGEEAFGVSLSSDGLTPVALQAGKAAHPGFWDGVSAQASRGELEVDKIFAWLESMDQIVDDTTLLTVVTR